MDNKSKIDRLHDLLPAFLNTRTNTNWSGLVQAIGEQDQALADLIVQVRDQFFLKTASRPYLDNLGYNNSISRPRLVGMSDESFRKYVTILSYQPKQVKLIIDLLIDIFFSKEATTAFIVSGLSENFALQNGWDLQILVDNEFTESIIFDSASFTSISSASAEEVAASYNRQAKYSYATAYYDSVSKNTYVKIFTSTIGSKGSLQIIGGKANIGLQFNGFLTSAGTGTNTQWTITKVGDTVTYTHTGGASPGINLLQAGDVLISNLPGNSGSFVILSVNLATNSIQIKNLLATAGVYTQTSANDTKFFRPEKYTAYKAENRAMTWETVSGEVTVETPATPPVVRRSLKGGWHLNGDFSTMTSFNSSSSLSVADATGFPASGKFVIEPVDAITRRILTPEINEVVTDTQNGRLIYRTQKYTYASRVVLTTTGTVSVGSDQITVASTLGLSNGMTIFMEGFRSDAVITDIVGSVITSSIPATVDLISAPVSFGGNTLTGITPALPALAALNEYALVSSSRTSNTVTNTTATAHNYSVGDKVGITGSSGIPIVSTTGDLNSTSLITNIPSTAGISTGHLVVGTGIPVGTKVLQIVSPTSVLMTANATATSVGVSLAFNEDINGAFTIDSVTPTQFTYKLLGTNGSTVTPGTAAVERVRFSATGSKIILTEAASSEDTRIKGSYLWDLAAPFVLSSNTASTINPIVAGKIYKLLDISTNTIADENGFIMIDYGKSNQEGPIRYLYKPADNVLALDPSYIFQQNHTSSASIVQISRKGPHSIDGTGREYAPYITDPAVARSTLETLVQSITSAGIFVNFLVRYPKQLYAFLDVYNSGA